MKRAVSVPHGLSHVDGEEQPVMGWDHYGWLPRRMLQNFESGKSIATENPNADNGQP